jgi:TatD family-associated radical SAM protein
MPAMNIVYEYQGNLYVNVTNRCTNKCKFCIRFTPSGVDGLDLWLEHEPSVAEIIEALCEHHYSKYDEIIICGYGEPLIRFAEVMEVCRFIKENGGKKVRINTNGHANKFAGRDVTREMKGLVDTLSISLNAKNAKEYNEVCVCDYGESGFDAMLDFAKKAKKYVPEVILSIVDVLPEEDIEECRKLAASLGVSFRVRAYSE